MQDRLGSDRIGYLVIRAFSTRHTVIEPRTRETNGTVKPDDLRPEPVQLFPNDSQLSDLGLSGDSNLWRDGYSYQQDNRENSRKGYRYNNTENKVVSRPTAGRLRDVVSDR